MASSFPPESQRRSRKNMDTSNRKRTLVKTKSDTGKWRTLHMLVYSAPRMTRELQHKERLENTYRLDPAFKFRPEKVTPILMQVLEKHLKGKTYDPKVQPRLTKSMTDEIKLRVKGLHFPRYRYVVFLTMGQKQQQGLRVASRCLWDADRDNFCSVSYDSNKHIFAVATVYAVYYE